MKQVRWNDEFRTSGRLPSQGIRISVAIATYNGARYLPELLDSISIQSVPPYEIVISDDKSSDETPAVIGAFALRVSIPIVLTVQDLNVGVFDNFMACFEQCTGDVISYTDQDDAWMPSRLAVCSQIMADDEVALLIHQSAICDENLIPTGLVLQFNKHTGRIKFPASSLEIAGFGHQMLFRRAVADTMRALLGVLEPQLKHFSSNFDRLIPLAAALCGDVVVLPQALVLFRRHGGSVSQAAKTQAGRTFFGKIVDRQNTAARLLDDMILLRSALESWTADRGPRWIRLDAYMDMLNLVIPVVEARRKLNSGSRSGEVIANLMRLGKTAANRRLPDGIYNPRDFVLDVVMALVGRVVTTGQ